MEGAKSASMLDVLQIKKHRENWQNPGEDS